MLNNLFYFTIIYFFLLLFTFLLSFTERFFIFVSEKRCKGIEFFHLLHYKNRKKMHRCYKITNNR